MWYVYIDINGMCVLNCVNMQLDSNINYSRKQVQRVVSLSAYVCLFQPCFIIWHVPEEWSSPRKRTQLCLFGLILGPGFGLDASASWSSMMSCRLWSFQLASNNKDGIKLTDGNPGKWVPRLARHASRGSRMA